MDAIFSGILGDGAIAIELSAVLLSLVLLLALRLSLPPKDRALIRQPLYFFAAQVAAFVVAEVIPRPGVARVGHVLSLLFMLVGLARSAVLLVFNALLGRRRQLPKIIRDITQGVVYALIGIVTLRAAGVEPGSLLTTSALLTAVIGLSLQETLGNLFAGLAIQMQRPFEVDDWIQFDAEQKNIGRVIEINWRATKVITLDEVELIVPNGVLAKSPIRNYTKPAEYSRRSIFVYAPYDVAPGIVQSAILESIRDAPGVVRSPEPSVVTNQFGPNGVEYWVRFFTDQFDRRDKVDGGVRDRIWHAMHRAEIAIPYPNQTVHVVPSGERMIERTRERKVRERARALRAVDIFQVLSDDQHEQLAVKTDQRYYAAGEVIVHEGDPTNELFLIERGEVAVFVGANDRHDGTEVARLGPGKFFGEMALVTGDRRTATVRAVSTCQLIEVRPAALKPILESSPDLAEKLSGVLLKRQAELDARAARTSDPHSADEQAAKGELLGRIRQFFSL